MGNLTKQTLDNLKRVSNAYFFTQEDLDSFLSEYKKGEDK